MLYPFMLQNKKNNKLVEINISCQPTEDRFVDTNGPSNILEAFWDKKKAEDRSRLQLHIAILDTTVCGLRAS